MNLKEIALTAGVSQSTVTLVLHGRRGVSGKTEQLVRELLLSNGYSIKGENCDAADVKEKIHRIVLLKYHTHSMLTDGNQGFISRIIDGLENECKKFDYELLYNTVDAQQFADSIDSINQKGYSGVILLGTEFRINAYEHLKRLNMPIVAVDNAMERMPVSAVANNPLQSMDSIVEYLHGRGHREIGFIKNLFPTTICDECFAGYLKAMEVYGLEVRSEYIFDTVPSFEGAYNSMKKHLEQGRKLPPALMCNIDLVALGALKAFREFGIQVPRNVSIVGADNIMNSALSDPPLTTVEAFVNEMGRWAVDILNEHINNPKAPIIKLRLNTQLIERGTVCDYADYVPPSLNLSNESK